jgi:hypothetical protein
MTRRTCSSIEGVRFGGKGTGDVWIIDGTRPFGA